MSVGRDKNYRESWLVKNKTKKVIAIGDLPLVPTINPGETVDLLKFCSREKISYSIQLTKLVKAGWLTFEKRVKHKANKKIAKNEIGLAITPAEEDELEDENFWDRDGTTIYPHNSGDSFRLDDSGISVDIILDEDDMISDDEDALATQQSIKAYVDATTVETGEEITDDTEGVLLYGKDNDSTSQPIGISGEENNEVLVMDLDISTLLEDIYIELIKANIQMAIITGNEIGNREINLPIE